MKSVFRLAVMAVLVATVAFVPGLTTRAQGSNCFGLSADDCALAQGAFNTTNGAKLTSFVLDYAISASATGTSSDGSFKLTGTGPLSIDTSKATGGAAGAMGSISALTMQNTLQVSATTKGKPMSDKVEVRILNGTLYVKDDMMTAGKWQSLDLTTAAGAAMSNPMLSGMLGGMTGGTGSTGGTGKNPLAGNPMMALFSDPAALQSLMKAVQTPGFITAKRGPDATSNGESFAAFVYTIDIPTLLKSPDFKPAIQTIMKAQGSASSVSDAQINQMIVAGSAMLSGVKLSFTEYVGATDKLPHGVAINLVAHFDAATAAMLNSSSTSNSPVDVNFSFDVKLSKVGQPVTVEAVTGATPLNMGGMMGGMGGGMDATPAAQ